MYMCMQGRAPTPPLYALGMYRVSCDMLRVRNTTTSRKYYYVIVMLPLKGVLTDATIITYNLLADYRTV